MILIAVAVIVADIVMSRWHREEVHYDGGYMEYSVAPHGADDDRRTDYESSWSRQDGDAHYDGARGEWMEGRECDAVGVFDTADGIHTVYVCAGPPEFDGSLDFPGHMDMPGRMDRSDRFNFQRKFRNFELDEEGDFAPWRRFGKEGFEDKNWFDGHSPDFGSDGNRFNPKFRPEGKAFPFGFDGNFDWNCLKSEQECIMSSQGAAIAPPWPPSAWPPLDGDSYLDDGDSYGTTPESPDDLFSGMDLGEMDLDMGLEFLQGFFRQMLLGILEGAGQESQDDPGDSDSLNGPGDSGPGDSGSLNGPGDSGSPPDTDALNGPGDSGPGDSGSPPDTDALNGLLGDLLAQLFGDSSGGEPAAGADGEIPQS